MTYPEWAARHPQAAQELHQLLHAEAHFQPEGAPINTEAYAQQKARLEIAKQGGLAWRNNVGASKAKEQHSCPRCQFRFYVEQAPIRWGLCNDSAKLNAKIKSSDLIGIVPRLITPEMVGTTIGQFLAVETKKQTVRSWCVLWIGFSVSIGGFERQSSVRSKAPCDSISSQALRCHSLPGRNHRLLGGEFHHPIR